MSVVKSMMVAPVIAHDHFGVPLLGDDFENDGSVSVGGVLRAAAIIEEPPKVLSFITVLRVTIISAVARTGLLSGLSTS